MPEQVVLTSISQVMQVFPEPALEEFEIEDSKIQGYILHESDIVRGIVNYDYRVAQHNDIEMSLITYADAISFVDFVWNPDGDGVTQPRIVMNEGPDYALDLVSKQVYVQPQFSYRALALWNDTLGYSIDPFDTRRVLTLAQTNVPVEFTVMGGVFNGQRRRAYPYDTGVFNDAAQQLFLNNSAVDPFIQRLCALFVVLDIIKFWIKPLYQTDNSSNIVGTQFSDKDSLPGWDHMQKRLENAIKEMLDAIKKWGIKNGRVGNGRGSNPEDPSLLRSQYIATAVRGSSTTSPTEYSPFMGWDDPFLFERPDRTSALGDTMFGYTGRVGGDW